MIAAFLELDSGLAIIAFLPSFFASEFEKCFCGIVLRAFGRGVPFVIAEAADFGLAPFTFTVLATVRGSSTFVHADVGWLDPLAAIFRWAVDTVLSSEFLKLPVPFDFEFPIKNPVNIFQGDTCALTAFRWHMLLISD